MIVPHPSLSRPPGTARRRGSSRDSFPHTAPQHTPRERSASERGEVGAEKGEEGLPFLLALVLRAAAACALPARPVADRASACAVRALAGLAAASPNHGGGGARDGGRGQGGPALRCQEVVSVLCIIEGPAFAALLPHADRGDGDAHALAAFAPSHPAGTPSPFGLGTSAPVRCLARPRASLSLCRLDAHARPSPHPSLRRILATLTAVRNRPPLPRRTADTCAICRNKLYEPSIEAQANPGLADDAGYSIAWGCCGHVFHLDCISRWLKTRSVCPLCNREWEFAKIEKIATAGPLD